MSIDVELRPDFDPVARAAGWAKRLIEWAHTGMGDKVALAIERAASEARVPTRVVWSLRYRLPKGLDTRCYLALKRAYINACLRQEAKLEFDIEVARRLPRTKAREELIRKSEATLRSLREERGAAE